MINSRNFFSFIFILLIIVLTGWARFAKNSPKKIAHTVCLLCNALIPPIVGNLLISLTSNKYLAEIGYYFYFIGVDAVMCTLTLYTYHYCNLEEEKSKIRFKDIYKIENYFLIIDIIQYALNPVFRHAFETEAIMVDGYAYFVLIPHIGMFYHRIIAYSIFLTILIFFFIKTIKASKYNSEKYLVILLTMIMTGMIQTAYIFSRSPIDRSMIGYGIFGIMVSYFSLIYRPVQLLDEMLAHAASSLSEGLFLFDASGKCLWINEEGKRIIGIKDEVFEVAKDKLVEKFGNYEENPNTEYKKEIEINNGKFEFYTMTKNIVKDDKNRLTGSFLSIRDVTEKAKEIEKEKYLSTHDSLTGILSKEALYVKTRELIRDNPNIQYLILYIDVKDFKIVNDIFGTEFGDFVLKKIAELIEKDMNSQTTLGRIGGDTFGICMPKELFNKEKISELIREFKIEQDSKKHTVIIHCGIYEVTEPDLEPSVMYDRAHMALLTIKNDFQTVVAYYDDKMREDVIKQQKISSQLHQAIKEEQIQPYLQPIVNQEGEVIGGEALVRWIHPEEGFMSPADFIPIIESNGMIADVDKHMWNKVGEILERWKKNNVNLFISVNISPKDFYFMDIIKELRNITERYDIIPGNLRVEITETVMMTNLDNRMKILKSLRDAGFIVEMDDFGSGYSSLSMLKNMPVDIIKIDMAFLGDSDSKNKAKTIVRNIIKMSDELGIETLTEGVETAYQYTELLKMGCLMFQGYHFAKPMKVSEFEEKFCKRMSNS